MRKGLFPMEEAFVHLRSQLGPRCGWLRRLREAGSAMRTLAQSLVIVGATEVVAAVGADQLAAMADEAMAAGGADLAVVIDGKRVIDRAGRGGAGRTTL